ncbi:hypothetical protein DL98DRAFT_597956 [Cadophora sp. DSE1049]|nr:hypothetical protein DL98DRAFT_597956 [Cadophora sp. DSE1049]
MSDDDSLYDSSSPSPSPPPSSLPPPENPTTVQNLILDKGKTVVTELPSPPASDKNSTESSSPEPVMTDHPAVQASPKEESQIVDDNAAELPPPPLEPSPKENLPVNFVILGEDPNSSEEETTPSLSNLDKDKGNEGTQDLGERPDTVDELGNVILAPDPKIEVEVEVLVVTTDEEGAAEVARAKLEESDKDIYPIGPRVTKPALPSPPSIPEQTTPENDKDTDTEYNDADAEQPTTGIERPVQKPGNPKTFTIVRLIENTDKRGNSIKSAIRLRKHYFDTDFGDFLLDMSGPRTDTAQVRNYAGQERYIPRRMLQNVYQPWDIPSKPKITDSGIPLPLAFLNRGVTAEEAAGNVEFEEEEPVMIMNILDGSHDQEVQVTDWERKAGRISLKQLSRQYERPWGILIDRDALITAWSKAAAPKLPKMKATVKGTKRKRKYEDDDSDTDEVDAVVDGHSTKSIERKTAGKKATKKQKGDDMGDFVVGDDPADDEAAGPTSARKKSTSEPPTKKPKLDVAVENEDVERIEVAKGKRLAATTTAGKTPAGKITSGKKPAGKKPAGKKPAKKTTAAKKTTKGHKSLLEAVAEEEESEDVLVVGYVHSGCV